MKVFDPFTFSIWNSSKKKTFPVQLSGRFDSQSRLQYLCWWCSPGWPRWGEPHCPGWSQLRCSRRPSSSSRTESLQRSQTAAWCLQKGGAEWFRRSEEVVLPRQNRCDPSRYVLGVLFMSHQFASFLPLWRPCSALHCVVKMTIFSGFEPLTVWKDGRHERRPKFLKLCWIAEWFRA